MNPFSIRELSSSTHTQKNILLFQNSILQAWVDDIGARASILLNVENASLDSTWNWIFLFISKCFLMFALGKQRLDICCRSYDLFSLFCWPKTSFENASRMLAIDSMTRFVDLLDFVQLFKAFGNNKFAQISHIFRHFLKRCQNISFF